jgi:arylsulfatase A-like enzyme
MNQSKKSDQIIKKTSISKTARLKTPLLILTLFLLSYCSKKPVIIEDIGLNDSIQTLELTDPISDPETTSDSVTTNASRTNVLFIIADDFGVDAMPRYPFGSRKAIMPTLEQLMDNGIRFTNVWTNPVCSPTRASILTGKYGYRTGVLNAEEAGRINVNEQTLHRSLNELTDSPYSTSIIGKWHLSSRSTPNRPQEMGIGHYAGLYTGGVDDYNNWSLNTNGESSNETSYITTKLTDLAIDWIGAQEQPWFCWLAYTAPHSPFHLPPTNLHTQGNLPEDAESIQANTLQYYLAMVESLDHEINRLLNTLSTEVRQNTVIVFMGDNGSPAQVAQTPFDSQNAKGSLYQGGIHVPMLISGAGVSRFGAIENALITSVDLHNTFLEIAGLTPNEGIDSQSFYSLLKNEITGQRQYNYTEVLNDRSHRSGHTIANNQYKLIVLDDGSKEYYDLLNDPSENTNLFNRTLSAEASAALTELTSELANIRR